MKFNKRRVVLLGATGSIGSQACDVIARHADRFEIVGAVAGSNIAALQRVVEQFAIPNVAVVAPPSDVAVPSRWGLGVDAACAVAAVDCDVVLVAITGAAALRPALAAIDAGRDIALANKEVMVMAGQLVKARATASGARFLPVDSEHSALWQCLRGEDPATIRKLLLTASGGPFRDRDPATMGSVTIEEALNHPNWAMGPKVTVDSATMMNKGLEIIEAHFLFDIGYPEIDVVLHPPSLVHSMVEFWDGATMAQIGIPDMRIPIALGLNGGSRLPDICAPADLRSEPPLEFRRVDNQQFPAVEVARDAGIRGGVAPAVMNAANEVAVDAFLAGRIGFTDIVPMVATTVAASNHRAGSSLDELLAADAWAREQVEASISAVAGR